MKPYPQSPGHKGEAETSRQAAVTVAPAAAIVRLQALELFKSREMTHDECAAALRPAAMNDAEFEGFKRNIRSRCSELKAADRIENSGQRRENASGQRAVVWRLKRVQTATVTVQKPVNTATTATQQELL